jgi:hypothetical protein
MCSFCVFPSYIIDVEEVQIMIIIICCWWHVLNKNEKCFCFYVYKYIFVLFFFVTYVIQPTQCLFGRVEIGCFYSLCVPMMWYQRVRTYSRKRITIIIGDEEKRRKKRMMVIIQLNNSSTPPSFFFR